MLRSIHLGRAFGIPLYLHPTFFLLPLYVLAVSLGEGMTRVVLSQLVLFAVFGCVLLHEYGHALAARYFGIGTRDITLYPIGGVARLERMSEKPWEEFWIAVAGPAVNVVIAALLVVPVFLMLASNPALLRHPLDSDFLSQFLLRLLLSNVVLVVFNMLPVFPMDGGRVLRALLATQMSHARATQVAVMIALPLAVLLGLAGWFVLHSPILGVLAFFVFLAGQQELAAVRAREQQRQRRAYYDDEEPLEVLPARRVVSPIVTMPAPPPSRPVSSAEPIPVPLPQLSLQPRITVLTYDPETGEWVQEPRRSPWGQSS